MSALLRRFLTRVFAGTVCPHSIPAHKRVHARCSSLVTAPCSAIATPPNHPCRRTRTTIQSP